MRQWWARAVALGCMAVASFARHSRSANLRHREEAALRPPLAGGPPLACREVAACSCSLSVLSQLTRRLQGSACAKVALLRIVVPTTASLSQKNDSLRIIEPVPAACFMSPLLLRLSVLPAHSLLVSFHLHGCRTLRPLRDRACGCRLVRCFCGSRPCGFSEGNVWSSADLFEKNFARPSSSRVSSFRAFLSGCSRGFAARSRAALKLRRGLWFAIVWCSRVAPWLPRRSSFSGLGGLWGSAVPALRVRLGKGSAQF